MAVFFRYFSYKRYRHAADCRNDTNFWSLVTQKQPLVSLSLWGSPLDGRPIQVVQASPIQFIFPADLVSSTAAHTPHHVSQQQQRWRQWSIRIRQLWSWKQRRKLRRLRRKRRPFPRQVSTSERQFHLNSSFQTTIHLT